jgi:hypothetical protein
MMLAEPEHVEADLIGEVRLLDQVAQSLAGIDLVSGSRVRVQLAEVVDTYLHSRDPTDELGGRRCHSPHHAERWRFALLAV